MKHIFPWLEAVQQQFRQRLQQQRLAHATLLIGHDSYGVLAVQDWLVATLLCTESNWDPCGQCHSCQLHQAGHHPDFLRLHPEGKAHWIKIDAVRELNQFCQGTAQQGQSQVISMVAVDRLNIAAANALLKTLEEPTPQTFLILQTAYPGALLPTIRSRTQRVICPKPSQTESLSWLQQQGLTLDHAERLLHLAQGSPMQALAWSQEEAEPVITHWQGLLLQHCQYPELTLSALKTVEDIPAILAGWQQLLASVLRACYQQSVDDLMQWPDAEAWINLVRSHPQPRFWHSLYDEVVLTQQQLQRPNQLNPQLLLEQLWFKLAQHCMKAQKALMV